MEGKGQVEAEPMPIRQAYLRLGFAFAAVLACAVTGLFSAGAQAAEPCPNEALRQELRSGQLPDCRAYELVSPAFKDGADAAVLAVSGDGSQVIASALGSFAGSEGEQSNNIGGPVYEFSRTASGWATTPLDPPAASFPALEFYGASRDLTRTLWVLREPPESIEEGDLYVREADGRFVEIGPLVGGKSGPPGGPNDRLLGYSDPYVGASADLSHVFISGRVSTDNYSLYEYVGTGVAKPELVGINEEGKQISNCGTTLGGATGEEGYNAISSNGEVVYFNALHESAAGGVCATPSVNQLYARIDRSETVAISEPSPSQCAECQTTVRQPAEFQGASEDGSKVFFTTKQELLKGQVTENLYELDFNRPVGERIVLVSKGVASPEVQGVARVSEDGSHVYFVAEAVLAGANREGSSPSPAPEAHNLYMFDEGRVTFIATLAAADSSDWQTSDYRPVQATPDGRFLVFDSGGQVFEYDSKEELLVNVSIGHAATIVSPNFREQEGAKPTEAQSQLAVSNDGSYVLFGSGRFGSGALSEYHSDGSISNGDVYPIFGNDGWFGFARIDASGGDVFFQSLQSLVAADTNTGEDTYDARINGGFPEPAGPVGCEGEACQGARSPVPLFGSPGSTSVPGGGNLTPAVEPKPVGKPTVKPLTQAQKLANALKACRHKPMKKRRACEKQARRAYGPARKANKSRNGGK